MVFRERVLIRIKYVCIKFYANTFSTSRVIRKNMSNYDKVSRFKGESGVLTYE